MIAYITRRSLLIVPTLIMITIIVFLLVRFIPGSVIDVIESEMAQMSGTGVIDREAVMHELGLDVPIHIQYGRWMGFLPSPDGGFSGVIQGNLGTSVRSDKAVTEEIMSRLPVTFELGIIAIIIGALVSLPIGVFSAIRQDTLGDYLGRTIAILGISLPAFWVATIVMLYPSLWWGWSPPMKLIPFSEDPMGNLGMLIIPAVIMGLFLSGASMRMTRTMMLEVLRQDYIRTAWAKGLSERVVIMRHALKNALIPVITIIGLQLPLLIGGAVIVEQIFSLPGVGRLMLTAINQRDYPMVSGLNLFIAGFVLVINLVVDLTYGFLDPRIRFN
ncbi:MAG: ABC transporter permease [Dehalococcoidales bacterium]|nr:ABC transporter permease [Dehalococcoidales bacterium]